MINDFMEKTVYLTEVFFHKTIYHLYIVWVGCNLFLNKPSDVFVTLNHQHVLLYSLVASMTEYYHDHWPSQQTDGVTLGVRNNSCSYLTLNSYLRGWFL